MPAPLNAAIAQSNAPPPVWPHKSGAVRGAAVRSAVSDRPRGGCPHPALYELLSLFEVVAARLGAELLDQLVFVGGAVAGLLVTDPALPAIRPTGPARSGCRI